MAKAMKSQDWLNRAHAYDEAADHLDQSWTDELGERVQGNIVSGKLRHEAFKCRRIAGVDTIEP